MSWDTGLPTLVAAKRGARKVHKRAQGAENHALEELAELMELRATEAAAPRQHCETAARTESSVIAWARRKAANSVKKDKDGAGTASTTTGGHRPASSSADHDTWSEASSGSNS